MTPDQIEPEAPNAKNGVHRYKVVKRRIVDSGTGQVIDAEWQEPVTQKHRMKDEQFGEPFALLYMSALIDAAPNHKWAVLLTILERWQTGADTIPYSNNDVAARVGIQPTYSSEMVNQLIAEDILQKVRRGVVRPNPKLFWKGKPSTRRAALLAYAANRITGKEAP